MAVARMSRVATRGPGSREAFVNHSPRSFFSRIGTYAREAFGAESAEVAAVRRELAAAIENAEPPRSRAEREANEVFVHGRPAVGDRPAVAGLDLAEIASYPLAGYVSELARNTGEEFPSFSAALAIAEENGRRAAADLPLLPLPWEGRACESEANTLFSQVRITSPALLRRVEALWEAATSQATALHEARVVAAFTAASRWCQEHQAAIGRLQRAAGLNAPQAAIEAAERRRHLAAVGRQSQAEELATAVSAAVEALVPRLIAAARAAEGGMAQ